MMRCNRMPRAQAFNLCMMRCNGVPRAQVFNMFHTLHVPWPRAWQVYNPLRYLFLPFRSAAGGGAGRLGCGVVWRGVVWCSIEEWPTGDGVPKDVRGRVGRVSCRVSRLRSESGPGVTDRMTNRPLRRRHEVRRRSSSLAPHTPWNEFTFLAFVHSVVRSFGRSIGRSVVRSFGRSFGRSVVRSFVRSFGRSSKLRRLAADGRPERLLRDRAAHHHRLRVPRALVHSVPFRYMTWRYIVTSTTLGLPYLRSVSRAPRAPVRVAGSAWCGRARARARARQRSHPRVARRTSARVPSHGRESTRIEWHVGHTCVTTPRYARVCVCPRRHGRDRLEDSRIESNRLSNRMARRRAARARDACVTPRYVSEKLWSDAAAWERDHASSEGCRTRIKAAASVFGATAIGGAMVCGVLALGFARIDRGLLMAVGHCLVLSSRMAHTHTHPHPPTHTHSTHPPGRLLGRRRHCSLAKGVGRRRRRWCREKRFLPSIERRRRRRLCSSSRTRLHHTPHTTPHPVVSS